MELDEEVGLGKKLSQTYEQGELNLTSNRDDCAPLNYKHWILNNGTEGGYGFYMPI